MSKRDTISRQAVDLLKEYRQTEDPQTRTRILKQVAPLLVEVRGLYMTQAGEPDWAGSTRAAKTAVGSIYRDAGFSEISTISAALRWHVGNVLRERLTPDELEAAHLSPETPRDRSVAKRERTAAVLASLRPVGEEDEARAVDPLYGVVGARTLLSRVDVEALSSLTLRERENLRRLLGQIAEECNRLEGLL